MTVDLHKLMAAINPDVYCEPFKDEYGEQIDIKGEVKKIIEKDGILAAAKSKVIKVKESNYMDFEDSGKATYYKDAFALAGIKNPIEKHFLSYEALGENLEPIYFWILDTLYSDYKDMKVIDKLIDNFASSPGSGHFSEMGMKATKMQEEAMKMLSMANQVIKSILNIVYDLKEFRTRIDLYKSYRGGSPQEKNSALLSLKQIWMDTVDMKRGNTALKGLAQQFQYVTLIDAFMASDSLKKVDELDLNDRVKRILQQRVGEFLDWIDQSEKELKKRYEIEKTYLKSQVSTVYLYARWAKPYLKAASQLEQNMVLSGKSSADTAASLVTTFNTALFELVLLGQSEYDPIGDVNKGDLPKLFKTTRLRKYVPLIIVEFKFRSIPERAGQQGYGFRGKVEINFTSYTLNEEELKLFKGLVQKDDLGDVLSWMEGATTESLDKLKEDIDFFIKDLDEESSGESAGEEKKEQDSNPFSALASIFKSSKKKEKPKEDKKALSEKIKSDSDLEKVLRSQAIIKSRQECRKIYDMYKKAHNMPSF